MLGFPAMPELLTIGEKVYPEEIFEIESDWKQIVASPEVGYASRVSVVLLKKLFIPFQILLVPFFSISDFKNSV